MPNSIDFYKRILSHVIPVRTMTFPSVKKTWCKKTVRKLEVLNRISSLLDPEKKKLVVNAVIKSHFSYCPLIWMFNSQRSNNLINRIHEKSLNLVYNDTSSTF